MDKFNQQNYIEAIKRIFSKSGNETKEQKAEFQQADNFVSDFSKQKQAWGICGKILFQADLSNNDYDYNVLIFQSAKILKTKLEYDLGQLIENEVQEFTENLIKFIQRISGQKLSRQLISQISQILILSFFHSINQWPDFIQFLQQNFYKNQQSFSLVYAIYEEMPDQIDNHKIVIEEEKRQKIVEILKNSYQIRVFQELIELLKIDNSIEYQYQALKCFRNWLDFDYNVQIWNEIVVNHPVFDLALQSTENEELQIKASDIIVSVLQPIKDISVHPGLFTKIIQHIQGYFKKFWAAVQEDLPDEIEIYVRIFNIFGKRCMKEFINNLNEISTGFFENFMKLTLMDNMDYIMEITDFWIKFFKTLKKLEGDQKVQALNNFENLIKQLINFGVDRIRFDTDHFMEYNQNKPSKIDSLKESYEEKNRVRTRVKHLFEEMSICINPALIVQTIASDKLQQDIQEWQQIVASNQDINQISCNLEGVLSSIIVILDQIQYDDINQHKQLIQQLLKIVIEDISINSEDVKLIKTALKYLLRFPEYLQNNQQLQEKAFQVLQKNLDHKFLGERSSQAFQNLCSKNPDFVKSYLDHFLMLREKFLYNQQILTGITQAVCSDDQTIEKYLVNLCMPYVQKLTNILQNKDNLEQGESYDDTLVDQLYQLTNIIRTLPQRDTGFPHELVAQIYREIFPSIKQIIQTEKKEKIIEYVVRFIKHVMRCINIDFSPFLKDLFEVVLPQYENFPISSYLYLIEITVTVFGQSAEFQQFLVNVLKNIFTITNQHFLSYGNYWAAFQEDPYISEDFFGLWSRILSYSPEVMLKLEIFEPLMQIFAQGVMVENLKVGKAMFSLAENFYLLFKQEKFSKIPQDKQIYYEPFRNNLIQHSQHLMSRLLYAITQFPPDPLQPYILDIVLGQIQAFPQQAQNWFFHSCQQQFGVDILTKNEIQNVIQRFPEANTEKGENEVIKVLELINERCQRSYMRNR
ncbi:Armadillo-type fold [Pseudocohnilembus persalinus]|uniref:Armadillo-type fold n=1 Tax=Pseudocohnilembus persalinus TaxID=266149 RepID=A0A0V0R488_PSEPJ|nr:Armadillo-type fold [Pseudocohnilembus persalinus]|eukprot:KRX09297.1 Armadillo-type fold [Pseudocohnilembus persalinus]